MSECEEIFKQINKRIEYMDNLIDRYGKNIREHSGWYTKQPMTEPLITDIIGFETLNRIRQGYVEVRSIVKQQCNIEK